MSIRAWLRLQTVLLAAGFATVVLDLPPVTTYITCGLSAACAVPYVVKFYRQSREERLQRGMDRQIRDVFPDQRV